MIILGCNKPAVQNEAQPKQLSREIFAVSYPLQFLTQSLIGDKATVINAASDSGDPKTTRPTRDLISQMQSADLIIANGTGATYAKWIDTASLPDSKIVNTASRALSLKDYIAVENEQIVHSHGPEGEHSHPVMASRTWFDPALAKKQSAYIAKQLNKVYPDDSGLIESNLSSLSEQLAKISLQLDGLKDKSLVVLTTDSKFKFLTRAIGAQDKTIKAGDAASITKQLNAIKPDFVLIDSDAGLDDSLKAALEASEVPIVRVSSLDRKPSSGGYLDTLQNTTETIVEACRNLPLKSNE